MIRKRTVFLLLNGLSVLTLGALPFGQILVNSLNSNWPISSQLIYYILVTNAPLTVIVCGVYSAAYSIVPSWLFTRKAKNRLKKRFIERIHEELLDGQAATHRVTLFREIGYIPALLRNYCSLFRHLFSKNRWRSIFYLLPPQYGNYLIVDTRCGHPFQQISSTMFRVETNEAKHCEGIVGYIRFTNLTACKPDLPDIADIDLEKFKDLSDIKNRQDRKSIAEYMTAGHIREFNNLRKMHSRARHFLGAPINKKDGSPWGVLLIDSLAEQNPFSQDLKTRFGSFVISVYDIINWEV